MHATARGRPPGQLQRCAGRPRVLDDQTAGEAGFTLLALPVLGQHSPWGVSVHTTWLAAAIFAALGLVMEGPAAAAQLRLADLLAIAYLAVAVTAVAVVLWYSSVRCLGAGRAGLLTGVAPVAAAVAAVLLGAPAPRLLVWLGIALVAAGLALGLPRADGRHQLRLTADLVARARV